MSIENAKPGLLSRTSGRGRGAGAGLSLRTAGKLFLWLPAPVGPASALRYKQWRGVVVSWVEGSDVQLIFIINDYEKFFRDPVSNGVYKYADTETLMRNWVDRENLVFWWEKVWLSSGATTEAPAFGSQKEAFGSLLDIIQILKDNAP